MEFQPFFADEPSLHSYDFTDTDEFEVEDKEIDDSSNSAGIDEYDMQNNETFGTGFVQSDNDMEEFANQAAELIINDEPYFTTQKKLIKESRRQFDETDILGTNNSIWSDNSFNGIGSLLENYPKLQKAQQDNEYHQTTWPSMADYQKGALALANAKTLDEIENEFDPRNSPYHQISTANSQKKVLMADELEKTMLDEAQLPVTMHNLEEDIIRESRTILPPYHQLLEVRQGSHSDFNLHPNSTRNYLNQNYCSPSPFTGQSHISIPPQNPFNKLALPASLPRLPICPAHIPFPLPPRLPPPYYRLPPFPPPTTMTQPPPMGYIQMMNQHPTINNNLIMLPKNGSYHSFENFIHTQNPPPTFSYSMIPSSLTNSAMVMAANKRRKEKMSSLSNRTISDFALDPYAGFMSKKEQEWLIKIHLIQCQRTSDQIEDDYYYSMWKKRNGLNKPPPEWKLKRKGRYYSFGTLPSMHSSYTAPSFSGSLGRPTHPTAINPRQMIDASRELVDEEINCNKSKKFKKILMRIENAELVLIECFDLMRKLDFFEDTQISNFIEQEEITTRTEKINANLPLLLTTFNEEVLLQTMSLQKGRLLVYRTINFVRRTDKSYIFLRMFIENSQKFAKKIPNEEINTFLVETYESFYSLTLEQLRQLVLVTNHYTIDMIRSSECAFAILLFLLFCLSRKANSIEPLLFDSVIFDWLESKYVESPVSFHNYCVFTPEDWAVLKSKLSSNIAEIKPGTIRDYLVNKSDETHE